MAKHTGRVKKSVLINANVDSVWNKLKKITKLDWLENHKSSKFLSRKKSGIGAIRLIRFDDGSDVEEHVVNWFPKKSFSYIAISGLPLKSYLATISIKRISNKKVRVTWESYFVSEIKKKEFSEFYNFLSQFYTNSLKNLKLDLE